METNQLQQPQPLQLVSVAQFPGYGIKIRPIKDYINNTVCGNSPSFLQRSGYKDMSSLCDKLSEINFDNLINTYHAVVGAMAAYKNTIPQHGDLPNDFYKGLREALVSPINSEINITFDSTGELVTSEDQAMLGVSVLRNNQTTAGLVYEEVRARSRLICPLYHTILKFKVELKVLQNKPNINYVQLQSVIHHNYQFLILRP